MDKIIETIEPKWIKFLGQYTDIDLHMVNELITYKDGTTEKRIKYIKDFKRPYWIDKKYNPTIKNNKNLYKTRKEFLPETSLKKYYSTQSQLWNEISKRTGKGGRKFSTRRDHEQNIYLYSSNIQSEVLLALEYKKKYGDTKTQSKVAVLDIEAHIDTGILYLNTIAMNDKLFMAINRDIFPEYKYDRNKVIDDIKAGIIKEYKDTRIGKELKHIEIIMCSELECAMLPIAKAHEWEPDYLLGWNMRFDVTFINYVLEKYGVRPEDVWSYPELDEDMRTFGIKSKPLEPYNKSPNMNYGSKASKINKFTKKPEKEFGYFNAILGKDFMITAGGVRKNKAPEEKYDVFETMSSFTILDSMQIFKINRSTEAKLNGGYSLANVLKTYTDIGKLSLEPDEHAKTLFGAEKHEYMVEYYPVEYSIYNAGDVLGLLEFELVTGDVTTTLGAYAGTTPIKNYNSGPQRLQNFYFEYALGRGYILGNPRSKQELDKEDELLGRKNFTITLGSELRLKPGVDIFNYRNVDNRIDLVNADLDQSSGYPSNTIATRLSINTVENEFVSYSTTDMEEAKLINMGLMYGDVNHVEFVNKVYKAPKIKDILDYVSEIKGTPSELAEGIMDYAKTRKMKIKEICTV